MSEKRMRDRTKLLILLPAMAFTPVGLMRVIGVRAVDPMGIQD